jgi:hypothetical protein
MRVGAQLLAQTAKDGAVAGFALAVRAGGSPEVRDLVEKHIAHGVEAVGSGKTLFQLDRPGFRVGDSELSDIGQQDVGPRRHAPPNHLWRFRQGPGVLPAKPENKGS